MIQNLIREGAPSPFPTIRDAGQRGNGGLCSHGVRTVQSSGGPYKFLPFAASGINWCDPQGMDVVSFPFTGCLMAVFTHNGVRKVAHISTGQGQDCLPQWQQVKAQSTQVFVFRPSDHIDTRGGVLFGCYGIVTPDLQTLAVTVTGGAGGPGGLQESPKIAAIVKARLVH